MLQRLRLFIWLLFVHFDNDEEKHYQLVGTEEADVKAGLLSIQTPVAKALLNRKVGDIVTVKVPKGEIEYEVLSIKYE